MERLSSSKRVATSFILLAIALFGAATPAAIFGRDVFVDNMSGDDRRDGSAPEVAGERAGPCRSIGRGLQLVEPGDRLVVANHGEPYRESVTLQAARHSGTTGQPFEIVGNGAMLDGRQPVSGDAWEHHSGDVYCFHPRRMAHLVLYLNNKPAVRHPENGETKPAQLGVFEWTVFRGQVYFRAEKDKTPRDYTLSCTALPVGVTLYDVHDVLIRDLVVQGFQLDGINAHDNVIDTSLLHVTSRGNGRSGISVCGASQVRMDKCILGDNGLAQIRSEGYSKTEMNNCDVIDNTAPAVVREGGLVTMSP